MDKSTEKRSLTEVFQHMWGQAFMGVTNTEEEVAKLVQKLQGLAGWNQEDAKKQLRELSARIATQRHEAEKKFDDALKQSVSRLRIPRREEIARLNARLDAISQRLDARVK